MLVVVLPQRPVLERVGDRVRQVHELVAGEAVHSVSHREARLLPDRPRMELPRGPPQEQRQGQLVAPTPTCVNAFNMRNPPARD